jgi:hypothetical protein
MRIIWDLMRKNLVEGWKNEGKVVTSEENLRFNEVNQEKSRNTWVIDMRNRVFIGKIIN